MPNEIEIGGNPLALDRVELETSGAVLGLPTGLTYGCNPPSCVFPKDTEGCVNLYGTPTGDVGDYPLEIVATAYIENVTADGA